jgi:predicted lysophospholipase L1 biosynthesis ABC-type transport system permease subunit
MSEWLLFIGGASVLVAGAALANAMRHGVKMEQCRGAVCERKEEA